MHTPSPDIAALLPIAGTRVSVTLSADPPVRDLLDRICLSVQQMLPDSHALVVLVDGVRGCLHFGGGPSVAAAAIAEIDQLHPDAAGPPIPRAAATGQAVYCSAAGPAELLPSIAAAGFVSVWAIPVPPPVEALLVLLFTTPRLPQPFEQAALELGAHWVQLALQHQRLREQQRDAAEISRLLTGDDPVAMVLTRLSDQQVLYLNHSACSLFAVEPDQFIDLPAAGFWVNPAECRLFAGRVERHQRVADFEAELRRKDGHPFWALLSARLSSFRGERVILAGVIDITARRAADQALRQSEEKFQTLFRSNPDLMTISTVSEGRYLEVNEQFSRLLGYARDEVMGRSALDLGVWADAHDRQQVIETLRQNQRVVNFETRFRHRDGHLVDCLISTEFIEFNGEPCLFSIARDITALRRTDAELRLTYHIFDRVAEGIVVTDPERRIIWVNPAFSVVTEYTAEEVIGKNPGMLSSGRHDAAFFEELWATVSRFDSWQGEIWNRRKSGDIYPEWLSINAVRDRDRRITHYVGVFSDISQQKMAAETIHLLSTHDALTRLPNRSTFIDRITQALVRARQAQKGLALLLVDLDRFKVINDSLGHLVGDRMLQLVASRLRECVGEHHLVARLGGDEFGILLEDILPEQISHVAEQLLAIMARPVVLSAEQEIAVTPSIGICVYPGFGEDAQTLIKHGDIAMYRAKADGRNTFRFFTPEMVQHSMEHLAMENRLRRAIDRGELYLAYQPRVDLLSQRVVGVEALIRWRHPELGLVPPVRFIPLAEETGLIHLIGRWVMFTACSQARQWLDAGLPPLRMAINLSAKQFREGQLADIIAMTLRDTGLDPDLLEVEVTESNIMADADEAVRILESLKALGVSVSIDDFGTGYSSLSYLKRFPIDAIKIDRSFVMDIPHDSNDSAIAQAVISLGHSLGLKVVAEGVETIEQLAFLRGNDCDEIQGYLFAKPLPADELLTLLERTQGVMSV